MPSVLRLLLAALQATTLVALVGTPFATTPAFASPLPLPLVTAYARHSDVKTSTRLPRFDNVTAGSDELGRLHIRSVLATVSSESAQNTRRDNVLDDMDSLNTYYTNMNQNAQTMSNLRNEVSGAGYSTNSNFQQQTVSTLTAYSSNLKSFQGLLAFLAADKGLANYDKSNQLETTLKNAVNTTKNVLSSISDMINADPTLGPLIGPLVYAIKCIIDEILDAVENLTDGILNDLQPLLQALLGQATDVTCSTGINILGLCLVLR